jgi:hypothetical protein
VSKILIRPIIFRKSWQIRYKNIQFCVISYSNISCLVSCWSLSNWAGAPPVRLGGLATPCSAAGHRHLPCVLLPAARQCSRQLHRPDRVRAPLAPPTVGLVHPLSQAERRERVPMWACRSCLHLSRPRPREAWRHGCVGLGLMADAMGWEHSHTSSFNLST